jgi:sialate O-acetylesterase
MCKWVVTVAVWALAAGTLQAAVRLNGVFQDHMVIQRDKPVRVYGSADPGEAVKVSFNGASGATKTGTDGKWQVELPAAKAGGPFELSVAGQNTITLKDVLVGDVWMATGQSNIERTFGRIQATDRVKDSPRIRFFVTGMKSYGLFTPQEEPVGRWVECNAANAANLSIIGYYFAERVQADQQVPVAIIDVSRGGSHIEQWLPAASAKHFTLGRQYVTAYEKVTAELAAFDAEERLAIAKDLEKKFANKKKRTATPEEAEANKKRSAYVAILAKGGIKGAERCPVLCYNARIHPFTRLPVRGILWYQGEYNCGVFGSPGPTRYAEMQRELVASWRKAWGDDKLPFLYVQLPNYGDNSNLSPVADSKAWPTLRNAQREVLDVPQSWMIVTIDIGGGLHPDKQKDVFGQRLADCALANVYGKPLPWSGPLVKSVKREGQTLRVSFDHVNGGLVDKDGGELKGFCLGTQSPSEEKGKPGKVVVTEAKARVEGNDVLVDDPAGNASILYYAHSTNPVCDLFNKAGLPASPFLIQLDGAKKSQ